MGKYIDKQVERIEYKKNFIKGFNRASFSSILFLLLTYLRKQKVLIGLSFLVLLGSIITFTIFGVIDGDAVNGTWEYNQAILIATLTFSIGSFAPICLIAFFSIPGILASVQNSTMIKRIGSTRVTEKSYVLIVWVVYYLALSLIYLSASIIFMILQAILFKDLNIGNSIATIFYMLLVIALLTSISTLIGTSPINRAWKIALQLILFAYIFVYGGIINDLTNILISLSPVSSFIFIALNPLTLSLYIGNLIVFENTTIWLSLVGAIYALLFAIALLLVSISFMSFNKIR